MDTHPLIQQLFDKYKLAGDFTLFVEIYLKQVYGQLLFNYAVGLLQDEAVPVFSELLENEEIPEDIKLSAINQIILDHSDLNMDQYYDDLVTLFVYHMDKNMTTIIKMYNQSIEKAESQDKVLPTFLEYLQTFENMKFTKFENSINNKN